MKRQEASRSVKKRQKATIEASGSIKKHQEASRSIKKRQEA